MQLNFFEEDPVVMLTRQLCVYEAPCPFTPRIVSSTPIDHGFCVNTVLRCLTCGRTGEESRRKDLTNDPDPTAR